MRFHNKSNQGKACRTVGSRLSVLRLCICHTQCPWSGGTRFRVPRGGSRPRSGACPRVIVSFSMLRRTFGRLVHMAGVLLLEIEHVGVEGVCRGQRPNLDRYCVQVLPLPWKQSQHLPEIAALFEEGLSDGIGQCERHSSVDFMKRSGGWWPARQRGAVGRSWGRPWRTVSTSPVSTPQIYLEAMRQRTGQPMHEPQSSFGVHVLQAQ